MVTAPPSATGLCASILGPCRTPRRTQGVHVCIYISACIKAITPLHVPKPSVVFPSHPRIAQALYNHHDVLKQSAEMQKVQQAVMRALQHRYPWAFRPTPQVPTAYALPNRKKEQAAGQLCLRSVDAFMRPLLEATSRLLHRICSIASLPGS